MPWHKKHCGCLNHKGTEKIMHHTADDARGRALKAARYGGRWEVYPCPVYDDVWHVTEAKS